MPLTGVRTAEAGTAARDAEITIRKNVCTFCSMGCTIEGEVANGASGPQSRNTVAKPAMTGCPAFAFAGHDKLRGLRLGRPHKRDTVAPPRGVIARRSGRSSKRRGAR
jgi:hypothetical protein